jgi:hypothetical protein
MLTWVCGMKAIIITDKPAMCGEGCDGVGWGGVGVGGGVGER